MVKSNIGLKKLEFFRFSGDTCTAIEEFQRDPYNNSLSSILPCNELRSAKSVLVDVSGGIYDLVNQVKVNSNILQLGRHFKNKIIFHKATLTRTGNTIGPYDIVLI